MSLFQSVLNGISQKFLAKSQEQQVVCDVLQEILQFSFSTDDIKIISQKVFVKTTPTVKMAIKIKEKEILSLLLQKNIQVISIQ